MAFLNIEIQTEQLVKYKLNLEIPKSNQVIFGTRTLWSNSLKIWNTLPYHIKTSKNLNSFKAIIKCWDGNHCTCRVCQHTTSGQQTLAKTEIPNSCWNLMHHENFVGVNLSWIAIIIIVIILFFLLCKVLKIYSFIRR